MVLLSVRLSLLHRSAATVSGALHSAGYVRPVFLCSRPVAILHLSAGTAYSNSADYPSPIDNRHWVWQHFLDSVSDNGSGVAFDRFRFRRGENSSCTAALIPASKILAACCGKRFCDVSPRPDLQADKWVGSSSRPRLSPRQWLFSVSNMGTGDSPRGFGRSAAGGNHSTRKRVRSLE